MMLSTIQPDSSIDAVDAVAVDAVAVNAVAVDAAVNPTAVYTAACCYNVPSIASDSVCEDPAERSAISTSRCQSKRIYFRCYFRLISLRSAEFGGSN